MKKILQITGTLDKHGTQMFIMSVLRNIDRSAYQFDFLIGAKTDNGFEKEVEELGSQIFVIPFGRIGFLKNFRKLKKFFRKATQEYDAIHYHANSFCSLEVLVLAKFCGVRKIITHAHNSSTDGALNKLLHKVYKRFVNHIATDWLACSATAKHWGYSGSKIENRVIVVNNPINLEEYDYNEQARLRIRENWNCQDGLVLGTVGRLSAVKNQKFLLKVLEKLLKYYPLTKLVIVGEGELRGEIEKSICEEGLEGKVILTGQQDNVAELLNAFDIFLLPSLHEGFPFVALEAQANGLPCIFSESISSEVLLTENSIKCSIEECPEVWAKKIIGMISNRHKLTDRAKLQPFSIENAIAILEAKYAQ